MQSADSKIKQYLNLFIPSGIGWVLYISLALFVMVLNQFSVIKEYLQIPSELKLGRVLAGWLDSLLNMTLGQSTTETLVVGIFWGFVGLAVYVFLRGISKFISELGEDLDERKFVWPKGTSRSRPLVQLLERSVFRVSVLIALLIFLFYPVAAAIRGPVFVGLLGTSRILEYFVWFVVLVLALHASIVLMRLFALRERLFG